MSIQLPKSWSLQINVTDPKSLAALFTDALNEAVSFIQDNRDINREVDICMDLDGEIFCSVNGLALGDEAIERRDGRIIHTIKSTFVSKDDGLLPYQHANANFEFAKCLGHMLRDQTMGAFEANRQAVEKAN